MNISAHIVRRELINRARSPLGAPRQGAIFMADRFNLRKALKSSNYRPVLIAAAATFQHLHEPIAATSSRSMMMTNDRARP
jgi:hypothetical protein